MIRILLVLCLLVSATGGTAAAAPAWQAPPPPVAIVVPPSILGEAGQLIALNGSASTGTGLTYLWEQTGGPAVTLSAANTALASFIFPFLPGAALPVFNFRLTVTDTLGRTSTAGLLVTEARPPAAPSLSVVPVPEPPNLADYVRDKTTAIQLGKALFWDMQLGSDGITACASCHYAAGTDSRVTNQVNPGPNGSFDSVGPNGTLQPTNFPLHLVDPALNFVVLRSIDDIIGTQGVQRADFGGINPGQPADNAIPVADPVFHVNGQNARQVTGRNAPSAVNAVFNVRNFWDGRANFVFNGVNPFGNRDASARIWEAQPDGSLAQVSAQIQYASLASQAVGPPNSGVEMAWQGRSFPLLGRKMLNLTPLALQKVDPADSVLAALVSANNVGIDTSYLQLIQTAFQPKYWDSTKIVIFDSAGVPSVADNPGRPLTNDEFSLIEMNFSLFFGLAVQLYEATLVSDDSPYDRYQEGQLTALTPQQLRGMDIFVNVAVCTVCHLGPEFTSATVSTLLGPPLPNFPAEPAAAIERMGMANGTLAIYDLGFYNIGVRPTAEDLAVGGTDPFGNPLSFSRLAQQGIPIGPPVPVPPLVNPSEFAAVSGAFKTPSLRNVELTAPYMHNGGMSTLEQVVDFYTRGADFAQQNIADLAPAIVPLPLDAQNQADLVAFLKALTDQRVRLQSAPFDHPQLFLPNGSETIEFPTVGASGGLAVEPFVEVNPVLEVHQAVATSEIRLGDTTAVTVTAANTGDVVLRNVVIDSNVCAFNGPVEDRWSTGALDPGEIWTFTCNAAPVEEVTNLVTVSGRHKLGQTVSATSTALITVQKPSLAVTVTPQPAVATPGQTVTYSYLVTNTGNVPLTNIVVDDSRLGSAPISPTTLPAGATATASIDYVAQVADILANVVNNVEVIGQPPLGGPVSATALAGINIVGPAIQVAIQPNKNAVNVGEAVQYAYTVSDLGDEALSNMTLVDTRVGSILLTATDLAPGASVTGDGFYLVLPTDAPGPLTNAATATGTTPGGATVTHSTGAAVPISGAAELAVTQIVPVSAEVGEMAQYTFNITNPGPVAFSTVVAYDSLLGPVTIAPGPLAPGQSTTASTLLDVVETQLPGPLSNTLTVTGTTVAGLPVTTTAVGSLLLTSSPQFTVDQQVMPTTASPGKTVTYTYAIQNTGNVTLRGMTATGDRLGPIALDFTRLAPGEGATGQATANIVEGDLPGSFVNVVTVTGTPAYGNGAATSATDSDAVALTSSPSIEVQARANPAKIGVGQPVSYLYTVRNTGDVTLRNIVLSDDRSGVIQLTTTNLAPGAQVEGTSSYAVQESDLPGPLLNGVSVLAMTALNQQVSATDATTVELTTGPAIQVSVNAGPVPVRIGQTLNLSYTVKNVGNITLDGIVVGDDVLGNVPLALTSLAPGASTVGFRMRSVTQGDLPSPLVHTATAVGSPTIGAVATATGSKLIAVASQPVIQATVASDVVTAAVGETVTFTYSVKNSGDVTLSSVAVSDARLGSIQLDRTVLQPGEIATGAATYVIDESDLDGPLVTTMQASALPPAGLATVTTAAGTQVVLTAQPALNVVWTPAASPGTLGQPVSYHYAVENAGNISLENLTLSDSRLGTIAVSPASLAPGESASGVAVLVATPGDLPGPIVTQVSASGTPVYGSGAPIAAAASTSLPLSTNPTLLSLIAAPSSVSVGQTLQYTYHITNTGDVALANLTAHDTLLGAVALAKTLLAPGGSTYGVASLPAIESLLSGPIVNRLTVTGTAPSGTPVTSSALVSVAIIGHPALEVVQQVNRSTANVGDSLTFAVQVRNSGDVTLRGLSVTSDRFGPLTMPVSELAPGATAFGQIARRVLEEDLPELTSAVVAVAASKHGGTSVIAKDHDSVVVTAAPQLELSAAAPASAGVGDRATFEYTLKNTGNVSLASIALNDGLGSDIALAGVVLAPGASTQASRVVDITGSLLPGPLVSRLVATAQAPLGQMIRAEQSTAVNLVSRSQLAVNVAVAITELTWGDAALIVYTVKNTGDVDVTNIVAVDERFGEIALEKQALKPGESTSGMISHVIDSADLVGAFVHTVTVSGANPTGKPVTARRSNTVAISGGSIIVELMAESGDPVAELQFGQMVYDLAAGGSQRFDALATGEYAVSQRLPAGWTAIGASCDTGVWASTEPNAIVINLKLGETVTCTFMVAPSLDQGASASTILYLPLINR